MSRIGKLPIIVPQGVKIKVSGHDVYVEGPKGKLELSAHPRMELKVTDKEVIVSRPTNSNQDRSLHGLTRTLINNMVQGVTQEYTKTLEIEGVGFRADLKGKTLHLFLGFSHPIEFPVPDDVKVEVIKQTRVKVTGASKVLVGQVAANIRGYYVPEPYKGKGVRYEGEQIRRKAGKAAG
jgi:large subunit ribosomal protein L6